MVGNFFLDVICLDKRRNSSDVCADPEMLEPGTRAAVLAVYAKARATGRDLRLFETLRSQMRQFKLWQSGKTQLHKLGCHGFGLAADFQLFDHGKYVSDGEAYRFLLPLCREVGLISGLDWGHAKAKHGLVDAGHVQRIPVWRQQAVFAGKWYPPPVYDPYADSESPVLSSLS